MAAGARRQAVAAVAFALAVSLTSISVSLAQNSPQDYLEAHNAARAEVGVEPLRWDSHLARYAQRYADKLAVRCNLEHSHGPYGENLYWVSRGDEPASLADDVVGAWVGEKKDYDYESNSCDPGAVCGHYTQVVWRDTERVGCGTAQCGREDDWLAYIVVCSYDPPGNWQGERPYKAST